MKMSVYGKKSCQNCQDRDVHRAETVKDRKIACN